MNRIYSQKNCYIMSLVLRNCINRGTFIVLQNRGASNLGQNRGASNLGQIKSQALSALRQAKLTLAKIAAREKRENVVNQRRGIPVR